MEMHMDAIKPSQPVRIRDHKYSRIVVQGLLAMHMDANEPSHKRSGKAKCNYSADGTEGKVEDCPDRQVLLKRSEYIARTFIMPYIQSNPPKLHSTTELSSSSNCSKQSTNKLKKLAHIFGGADGKNDVASDQTDEMGLIGMHIDSNNKVSINISDQYRVLYRRSVRFKCNHCGKEVSTLPRLKYHLGGVRKGILPCPDVPADIRKVFLHDVLLKEKEEIESCIMFNSDPPPVRRKLSSFLNCFPQSEPQSFATSFAVTEGEQDLLSSRMHKDDDETLPVDITDQYTLVKERSGRIKCNHCGKEVSCVHRLKYHLGGVRGVEPCPNVPLDIRKQFRGEVILKKIEDLDKYKPEKPAPNSDQTKKSTTSFILQGLVNLKVANSPSLQQVMLSSIGKDKSDELKNMQSNGDVNCEILEDKLQDLKDYVNDIKKSWSSSGCSILLDGWINEEGRELVTFLVDCPRGPIYLQSSDVSSLKDNVDALYCMVNEVVEEIGEDNVVQVVASSITGWMGTLGEQFMKKCKTVFWCTSASHCINLMLEKIGRVDYVKAILENAKKVMENSGGLVKPSKKMDSAVVPFETLEKILLEKNKLEELVNDACFWKGAAIVVKATKPLVQVLDLIHGDVKLLTGYIYEAMDEAKERIREELIMECYYMKFWNIIDEIWDNHLHSPLHAAGYYLNPSLFYSSNFHIDGEVFFGLLCCIVRMFRDHQTQDLISMQLNDYRFHRGAFREGCTPDNRTLPPLEWWAKYGGECLELQKFATRVLSQTCDGASRYGLTRQMAEKLLKCGNEKQYWELQDVAFVHYNLELQKVASAWTG